MRSGRLIGHLAGGTAGRAGGGQNDVAAGENVAREVREHAAIRYLQSGTVIVERTCDLDRQVVTMSEVDAERLAVSLRLVVARPWTRAGDVAAIGLRGRYVRGIRVTVDLARRKEEKPLHRQIGRASCRERVCQYG